MREIPLTRGYVAIVDDADYDRVMAAGLWQAHPHRHTVYAQHSIRKSDGTWTQQTLHRFLLSLTDPKRCVDHVNRNGLDNQRENLREASASQNRANSRKPRNGVTSRFRGVAKRLRKWEVSIKINGKTHYLGCFPDEVEAALAYDAAARQYFGDFANCNFPPKKDSGSVSLPSVCAGKREA